MNIDINECALCNGGCQHTCINTEGNYSCSCDSGYVIKENGLSCEGMTVAGIVNPILQSLIILYTDINECALNNGGCQHKCINTDGSYYCSCDTGYDLQQDKLSCQGTDI